MGSLGMAAASGALRAGAQRGRRACAGGRRGPTHSLPFPRRARYKTRPLLERTPCPIS